MCNHCINSFTPNPVHVQAFVAKFTASGTLTIGETGSGVTTNYLVVGGGGGSGGGKPCWRWRSWRL